MYQRPVLVQTVHFTVGNQRSAPHGGAEGLFGELLAGGGVEDPEFGTIVDRPQLAVDP